MSFATTSALLRRQTISRLPLRLRSGCTVVALPSHVLLNPTLPCAGYEPGQRLPNARGYATQQPPGGMGGGIPNFLFQQPRQKGETLKEYVGVKTRDTSLCYSHPFQSVDLTEMARNGKLDPTIGRDEGACRFFFAEPWHSYMRPTEIRRTIQSELLYTTIPFTALMLLKFCLAEPNPTRSYVHCRFRSEQPRSSSLQ